MFRKKRLFSVGIFALGFGFTALAQEARVTVNQAEILPELLKLKTEMVQDSRIAERYRIQIFSGDFDKAVDVKKEYDSLQIKWPAVRAYETPNYKIWIGNFRNSLEADRALLEIREYFPAAFRFKPERK